MRKNDCVVDCVGPDCEGCREYKTAKSMETNDKKPTKEEILQKYYGGQSISMEGRNHKRIWFDDALKAMQEYAEEYHKDKLKDELVKFTIFISKMDYKDAAAERVINEYLEIIE